MLARPRYTVGGSNKIITTFFITTVNWNYFAVWSDTCYSKIIISHCSYHPGACSAVLLKVPGVSTRRIVTCRVIT